MTVTGNTGIFGKFLTGMTPIALSSTSSNMGAIPKDMVDALYSSIKKPKKKQPKKTLFLAKVSLYGQTDIHLVRAVNKDCARELVQKRHNYMAEIEICKVIE